MVGLSIVLEEHHHHHHRQQQQQEQQEHHHHRRHRNATMEVISKTNMPMVINNHGTGTGTGTGSSSSSNPTSPSSSSSSAFLPAFHIADFLNQCFLCRAKLFHGKDIYMYRGDRAFCSEECRCRQILLDEEEAFRRENQNQSHCSSAVHPSSSRNRRGTGNRAFDGM